MGKIVKKNLACLNPDCGSSDARQLYEDGTSFCFSCREFFPKSAEDANVKAEEYSELPTAKSYDYSKKVNEINSLPVRGFQERKIEKAVCEFFGVKVAYNDNGEIAKHYYPYGKDSFKERSLPKSFTWINFSTELFGKDKFAGEGKRLIITEGEIDALSVAQSSYSKYGKIYPVVALSSAAIANKSLLENREWIRSFKEVIICFDEDEAGEQAKKDAVRIIGLDKVKLTKLPFKDANEVMLKKGSEALMQCIFEAAKPIPSGIITKEALWESLIEFNNKISVPYPPCISGVTEKTKGMREGEIVLFTSGTGSGKSTLFREIILHILETTEDKVGIMSFEEAPPETARKLSGMVLHRNPAKEEIPLEELKVGFDQVFGGDRVMLLDHDGPTADESLIEKLEYMCLSGCKYIFIDHITILVSEGVENLTGNEAQDKMMNDLLRVAKKHNPYIGIIAHLRKTPVGKKAFEEGQMASLDDIRGSGSIKQISFDIIAFARNLIAEDELIRNTINIRVLKCRYTGLTGDVPSAIYDYNTGRMYSSSDERFAGSFE
jgi:twinkle protein